MKRVFCLLFALLVCLCACEKPADEPQTQTPVPEVIQESKTGADYSEIEALLAEVPADFDGYTKQSVSALKTAMSNIPYDLTADRQDSVDQAAAALKDALAGLSEVLQFKSLAEIITYVDSLGIDFNDLASFEIPEALSDAVLDETAHAGNGYLDNTVYIGDSITLYMHRYSSLSSDNIYGIGSITPKEAAQDTLVTLSDGTPATFAQAMGEHRPRRVVLTIGTNSMLMSSMDYLTYFDQLIRDIQKASPDTQIIVQSTSPLTAKYEANMRSLTNRAINRANLLLCGLCLYDDVYFLNSAEALKDEHGQLDVQYDLGEGYGHINAAAYAVWEEYLCTHAILD